MKTLIKKILKEQSESNKEKFIRYVASKLKPPYFKNINDLGVEKNEIEPILSLIFNQPVRIKQKTIYDELDNEIYDEDSDGSWEKKEYDERGNLISTYYKYSDGSWEKYEYDKMDNLIQQFSEIRRLIDVEPFLLKSDIQANFSPETYKKAFQKIKHYLKEGDCYQVNLTQRFSADCQGEPWAVYQVLREVNAAPFSAYIHFPHVNVLSSSPERFLKLTGRHVETKPIKGTRPRKVEDHENVAQIADLQNSAKDRAENVMIVDLLRNDISKVCENGSVHVPKLFDIESYSTVHHLVSTVTGTLALDQHALDLLKHCFPGGSITGAPKIRSMEVIEEIEPHRRGIYCGAIGYVGFNGNMDTNIAIRTLVESANTIRFWAGGGIVNDSVVEDEYQESFDKAAALFQVLKRFQS